jgi:hypothetical protein
MEITMKRLMILTTLASLYATVGSPIRSAAAALLAQLYAASLPVWLDPAETSHYVADDAVQYRQAAAYVDRILRGGKPAGLPGGICI